MWTGTFTSTNDTITSLLWDVMIFYILDYNKKKLGRAQTLLSFVK